MALMAGVLAVVAIGGICSVPLAGALSGMIAAVAAVPAPQAPRLAAQLASQNVAVVDGETLRLAGRVVRLDGVAAPRRGEACRLAADCAGAATLQLAALVRDQQVACTLKGADSAGRPYATCHAGTTDIAQAEVASGWAAAATPALAAAEQFARVRHQGLWSR
jgi:endonuclease YncB( thermonuclease family)